MYIIIASGLNLAVRLYPPTNIEDKYNYKLRLNELTHPNLDKAYSP